MPVLDDRAARPSSASAFYSCAENDTPTPGRYGLEDAQQRPEDS
jgi:hypothetical protein